jgi:hypothetical protein
MFHVGYLISIRNQFQGTKEEKDVSDILFDDSNNIAFGDQRLNSIAALTYNSQQCENILRF